EGRGAVQRVQAEPGEDLLRAMLRAPHVRERRFGQQRVIAGAGGGSAARERLPRLGELPFEAAGALERVGEDRLDRDAATERQLLAEHPDRSGDLEGPG